MRPAQDILASIGEPVLSYDTTMEVEYANAAAARLLEEGALAGLADHLRAVMLSSTPATFEYAAGGHAFTVRADPVAGGGATVLLREHAAGDPHGYRGMLEAVMENIPIGIAIAEAPDVRVRWVSRHGDEITGIARSAVEGLPYPAHGTNIFRADGVPGSPEELPLTRATRQGEVVAGEEWMIRKESGEETWLLCDAAPIRDAGGAISGGILAFSDITARKRADAALRKSEERLRLAQRAARCGTWDWNIETGEVDWSDEYYALHRIDPSVPPSYEYWLDTVHPDDRERARAAVERALAERADLRVDFRAAGDGPPRWFEVIGSTMTGVHGRAVRMLGIVLDITERKGIEEELQYAVERLRSSNEDLQKFAYVVSHDLQEPLRMIRGYAQLLARRQKVDEEGTEFLGFIDAGVNRMQSLIRDLLEYSRVSYGERRPLTLTDCNYSARLAVEHLGSAIAESGAEVTIEPLPSVMADDARMLQVFQNLIGNAVKYRAEAPPRIHISAEQRRDEWVFSIRDNGIGIAPAYHERIFGVFQRLHARDQYAGTGIGLAIVKRIIEQQGGRVWVESQLGEGSTFHFTLPGVAARAAN